MLFNHPEFFFKEDQLVREAERDEAAVIKQLAEQRYFV